MERKPKNGKRKKGKKKGRAGWTGLGKGCRKKELKLGKKGR